MRILLWLLRSAALVHLPFLLLLRLLLLLLSCGEPPSASSGFPHSEGAGSGDGPPCTRCGQRCRPTCVSEKQSKRKDTRLAAVMRAKTLGSGTRHDRNYPKTSGTARPNMEVVKAPAGLLLASGSLVLEQHLGSACAEGGGLAARCLGALGPASLREAAMDAARGLRGALPRLSSLWPRARSLESMSFASPARPRCQSLGRPLRGSLSGLPRLRGAARAALRLAAAAPASLIQQQ